jgi:predicted DNA-binding transcriptional regulator AlpA
MEIEQQLRSGDKLLSTGQVAKLLGVSRTAVLRWQADGSGPPFIRIHGASKYPERQLFAWVKQQNPHNERG